MKKSVVLLDDRRQLAQHYFALDEQVADFAHPADGLGFPATRCGHRQSVLNLPWSFELINLLTF